MAGKLDFSSQADLIPEVDSFDQLPGSEGLDFSGQADEVPEVDSLDLAPIVEPYVPPAPDKPIRRRVPLSPRPTPDMPGARIIQGTGDGKMANPAREEELNRMFGTVDEQRANTGLDLPTAPTPKPRVEGEFTKAFIRSVGPQNMTLTGHTMKAYEDLTGDTTFTQSADEMIADGERWSKGIAPAKVPTMRDIDLFGEGDVASKFGRVGDWVKQGLGSSLGSTVIPLAGGLAGGMAGRRVGGSLGAKVGALTGAFFGSNALNIGSMRQTLIEEGVTDPKLRGKISLVGGVAMSGLDSLVPGQVTSKLTGGVRKEMEKAIIKRMLSGAKSGSIKEGLTEGAQQAIEESLGKTTAGKDIDPWHLVESVVENAAQGALGGAIMQGAGDAMAGPGAVPPPVPPPIEPQIVAPGKSDRVSTDATLNLLKQAGITPDDIKAMSPQQFAQTIKDLQEQGAMPEGQAPAQPQLPEVDLPPTPPGYTGPTEAAQEAPVGKEGVSFIITQAQKQELVNRGYTPEQIRNMRPTEAHGILKTAPDAPVAEPVKDVEAQIADMQAKGSKRQGVYLSKEALDHVGEQIHTDAGVIVPDFDGKGGVIIARTKKIAAEAVKLRDSGVPLQEVLGKLTGAGTGKPADGTHVVQQLDPQGNVTRESVVTKAEIRKTRKEFTTPGKTVKILTPDEALKRRQEGVQIDNIDFGDQVEEVGEGEGTRASPVKVATETDLEVARAQVNPEPTDGQKEAGNYQKGHVRIAGLDVTIENPKGSIRTGKSPDGKEWSVKMPVDYGYVKRTTGSDEDHADVFIGPNPSAHRAYVINQIDPETGKHDEYKSFVGFDSMADALDAYRDSFSDGSGDSRIGGWVNEIEASDLKAWLDNPPTPDQAANLPAKELKKQLHKTDLPEGPKNEVATVEEKGLYVQFGKRKFPMESYEQASKAILKLLDETGGTFSGETGPKVDTPLIVDAKGNTVGYISQNGRVWPGKPEEWESGNQPLYNPYADELPPGATVYPLVGQDFQPKAETPVIPPKVVTSETAPINRPEKGSELAKPAVKPKKGTIDELLEVADPIIIAFRDRLIKPDGGFNSILHARKFAQEHGFKKTEDADNKDIEEKIEFAVVLAARQIVKDSKSVPEAYDSLVALYNRQPKLGTRTSKSMAEQAYSTPAPIAFIASRLAGVADAKGVYEPTAGNGMLLIEAEPLQSWVNELDKTRATNLAAQGFTVTRDDATEIKRGVIADSVIMNPPFGAVMDKNGKSKRFEVPEGDGKVWTTTRIDYAIALRNLKSMRSNGRAVLILGGPAKTALSPTGQEQFYNGQAQREFYYRLYQAYNVTDHFTIEGDLYNRQGAGWPIDMLVIDGRGKSALDLPAVTPPSIYGSFDKLKEKLDGRDLKSPQSADKGRRPAGGTARTEQRPEAGNAGPDTDLGAEQSAELQPEAGQPGRVRDGRSDRERSPQGDRGPTPRRDEAEPAGDPNSGRVDKSNVAERQSSGISAALQEGDTAFQRKYVPASTRSESLNTLVPSNMSDATRSALQSIGEDVDKFVASHLGYKIDELKEVFSAEQVDAVALGIREYLNGGALILGDQTGIGKGRVVAGLIRFALKQGQIPVFVTEKVDLYGDMFRDMKDIRLPEMLGRDVGIFATNSGAVVPLDDEAVDWKGESDEAEKKGIKPPPWRGTFLRAGSRENVERIMADSTQESIPGYDVVFTTYDQTNTVAGKEPFRRGFLKKIIPNAFLILDESHNAGGAQTGWEVKGKPDNRAEFLRKLVDTAKGIMYSSATYAKRPDVMDLYRRTDMSKSVEDISKLGELIQKGGVPMQQVVASMLAKNGQYIRRERSFDGIEYALTEIEVDREAYDSFSDALRSIQQFDLNSKVAMKTAVKNALAAKGEAVSKDPGTGVAGASTTAFASVMHNLVGQMILSIKSAGTVKAVVESLKKGEKPVIALASTMESFIDDYVEEHSIGLGEPVDITFKEALHRYLKRSLRVTVKRHDRTTYHLQIPITDLPGALQRMYADAETMIDESKIGALPISPIDYLRNEITKAGYKVKEITGRQRILDYSGEVPILRARDKAETGPAGKRVTVKAFNDGKTDVLIFNRSGATGISMHSGPHFKDQRKRRMFLQQAEGNIDTHMQTLGRTNRTGQVVKPAYSQLAANIPAEARPAALILKKMASLNANTTASRKGALSDDRIIDFMNQYGDQVVFDIMIDRPELHAAMNNPLLKAEGFSPENAAAKVTGRMTLLKLAEQEELLDLIAKNYTSLIEQLDATGENMLEAKSMDLQARKLDTKELKARTGSSVFEDGVYSEWTSIKTEGKAMGGTGLVEQLAELAGEANVTEENRLERWDELTKKLAGNHQQTLSDLAPTVRSYNAASIDALKDIDAQSRERERQNTNTIRFKETYNILAPGNVVGITGRNGMQQTGVVLSIKRTGHGKNPIGLSSWEVKFAVPSSARTLTIPMSQILPPSMERPEEYKGVNITPANEVARGPRLEEFDVASKEGREDRWIITGNLLSGYDQANGKGQIINYTTDDGDSKHGILMPKDWDYEDFVKSRPVDLGTSEQVMEFLDKAADKTAMSRDGIVDLITTSWGYQVEISSNRTIGGKYFLFPAVREAANDRLTKAGDKVRWQTRERDQFANLVEALMKAGAKFETRTEQELAQSIVNPKKPEAPAPMQPAVGLNPNRVRYVTEAQMQKVKASLDRLSIHILGHRVPLDVVDELEGAPDFSGGYAMGQGKIAIALGIADDPVGVFAHETIHYMREKGLITKPEWAFIARWAQKQQSLGEVSDYYIPYYGKNFDASPQELLDKVLEEVLAFAVDDVTRGKRVSGDESGHIERIIRKLLDFLEALRNLMSGAGFQTVESLIDDILAGRRAGRTPDPSAASRPFNWRHDHPNATAAVAPAIKMPKSGPQVPRTFREPEDDYRVIMQSNLPLFTRLAQSSAAVALPVRRALQDTMADMARIEDAVTLQTGQPLHNALRVYQTETLYAGRAGERIEDLRLDELEPLAKEMKQLDLSLADLDDFLYARHAPERNAYIASINPQFPDGGSGMTNADAQQIMADLQRRGKYQAAQQVAQRMDRMRVATLDKLLSGQIIDQYEYNSLLNFYQHYVPLKGDPNADDSTVIGAGKKYDTRTKPVQQALGRRSRADSPVAHSIAQAQQAIILAEKARVGRAFLRFARRFPNRNLWEVNQIVTKRYLNPVTGIVQTRPDNLLKVRAEDVLAVREGGNLYWITIHHNGLLRGLKGVDVGSMHAVFRTLITLQRGYALMRTGYDPQFFIANFLRDLQTAGLHITADQGAALLKATIKNIPKAMKGVFLGERGNLQSQWAQIYREFAQAGGKVGVFGLNDIEVIKANIDKSIKRLGSGPMISSHKALTAVSDFMLHMNSAVENAVRVSLYKAMRDAGYSVDESAFAGKEVTVNFNRKGHGTKWLSAFYVFFNAGIQGPARVVKAIYRRRFIRRAVMGLFISGFLLDLINAWLSGDSDDDGEDDYDQIAEHIRERNWIIMLGGKHEQEKGGRINIPQFFTYNVFHYAGVNLGRMVRGKITPMEAAANVGGALLQAGNPLQSYDIAATLSPTFLDPWVEHKANQDWKGDPIMPEDRQGQTPTPDSQKAFSTVNPAFREAAEAMNSMTGGDEIRPGIIDVSPETLEYIGDFLGGGVSATFNQIMSTAGKITRGEDLEWERVPFVRKLYGTHSTTQIRNEYYTMRDAVHITMDQYEKALKAGDAATVREIKKTYGGDIGFMTVTYGKGKESKKILVRSAFEETDKLLTQLRKQRNAATTDQQRQVIQDAMDRAMSKTKKAYRQALERGNQ